MQLDWILNEDSFMVPDSNLRLLLNDFCCDTPVVK